ncbi:MAG: 23S rRNA (pseudouridine(1915)-N(3))-methyltransferase RlmH [Christensenellales bacterium]
MGISIIAVGRIAAPFKEAAEEYLKRLSRFAKVAVTEMTDNKEPPSLSPALLDQLKTREGKAILARLKPQDHVIALCIDGSQPSSEAFSQHFAALRDAARPIVFVIGGSLGLSEEVLARADERLSLSVMTYPHQLARVVLLEQLYRAFKILGGERYHK